MSEYRTLLYMFHGKLETEQADRWKARDRMKQLLGATATLIYQLEPDGRLYAFEGNNDYRSEVNLVNIPEEIRLAAMLVN